jgi:hypothetical protein
VPTKRGGEVSDLDLILKRVWQNGYEINQWDELKAELRSYFGEQIAREIEAKCNNPIVDSYRPGCWEYQDESFGVTCTHISDAAIARGLNEAS